METEELWAESDARFDSGAYGDAIPYYDELLRRNGDDSRALVMRGVSHERTGNSSTAFADYAQAGSHGDVRGLLYSANLHIRQGELSAAEEDLGRLRDAGLSGRDQVIQLTLLGTLRLKQGQNRLAAQSLERAAEQGAQFGDPVIQERVRDAHYNAGQAYYRMGDFGRAYDHMIAFAQGQELGGQDAYLVGLMAYLAGDFQAADQYLAQADPDLVAEGAKILDDPSFGAAMRQESP
jgi:tetratricopeptide (TPR) repeat protein